MNLTLLKKPSAIIPLLLSLAAFSLAFMHASMYSGTDAADDMTTTRMFRYLLCAEIPVMGFFAVRWLPREWGDTLRILFLQIGAALAAIVATVLLD